MHRFLALLIALPFAGTAFADGPKDNIVDNVRPVPPPGIKVPDEVRQELQTGVDALGKEIEGLKKSLKAPLAELLPDVQIFHKAVRDTLLYNEFYNPKEFDAAKKLLTVGGDRAKALKEGKSPWMTETGPSVRGYLSRIDGSVQPYGLFIPSNYKGGAHPFRLDVWFHGRFESNSEVGFVSGMMGSKGGALQTPSTIICQPYGRYSNANHFAGEIDTLEVIENISKHYIIDPNRIVVSGFSMGGAACWNFAVHYAGRWAAAAPGAGFSESPDFLRVYQNEKLQPTWYEKKLYHLYDCTDWAINLTQCPTVAYSGEKDSQKQAADLMVKAMGAEGMDLVHIIGPGMGHSYHPKSKAEIEARLASIVKFGRPELPKAIHFATYTLRYNQMRWVTIDQIAKHWERSQIDAELTHTGLVAKTKGIERFTLTLPPGAWPWDITRKPTVLINEVVVPATQPMSDRSWKASFVKTKDGWQLDESKEDGLSKRHGLTGPIDDAFMAKFVVVRPTGTALNEKVGSWTTKELDHLRVHWRKQFRGDLPIKDDSAVKDEDIASSNLILFGDPSSNAVLKKIADKLPIEWTASGIKLGKDGKTFDAGHHAVAMIYPNPLNPKKYVVLNSGFTYREYDYLNNARQIPKLPDWVVFDVNQPTTSKIAADRQ